MNGSCKNVVNNGGENYIPFTKKLIPNSMVFKNQNQTHTHIFISLHKKETWVLKLPKFIRVSMKFNKNWLICNLYGFGKKKTC
jgi:hypothetical protein